MRHLKLLFHSTILLSTLLLSGCFDLSSEKAEDFTVSRALTENGTIDSASSDGLISGTPPTTIHINQLYTFTPIIQSSKIRRVKVTVENLPVWASYNRGQGTLSGIPGAEHTGIYRNIIITASDGRSSSSLPPFDIEVVSSNAAPVIQGTPITEINEGEQYVFQLLANDSDNDTLSFSIQNRPAWAYFDNSNGSLVGTPGFDSAGVYQNIVITASDGQSDVSLNFDLTVYDTNRPPTITSSAYLALTESVRTEHQIDVTDPDRDAIRYSIQNNPDWSTLDASTGRLVLYPGYDDAGTYDNILVTVSDSMNNQTTQTLRLSVANNNRAPVVSNMTYTGDEDQTGSFTVTASDPDRDQIRFDIIRQPANGRATLSGSTVSVSPNQDFCGNDYMVIRVTDSQGAYSDSNVSLTIHDVDDIPQATADITSIKQGESTTVAVLENDSGLGDGGINLRISGEPSSGIASITATHQISYTPVAGFSGQDALTYEIMDSDQDISTANLTITVEPDCSSNCSTLINLVWEPSTSADITGYRVYYGNTSGQYENTAATGNSTHLSLELDNNNTWYLAATALNAENVESSYSNEVQITLP